MSTYYKLACSKCEKVGGFLSRQMWGCGNFDIFRTFYFMADHMHCPEGSVYMVSEHSREYEDFEHTEDDRGRTDCFPHSNDWENFTARHALYLSHREIRRGEWERKQEVKDD